MANLKKKGNPVKDISYQIFNCKNELINDEKQVPKEIKTNEGMKNWAKYIMSEILLKLHTYYICV